MTTSSLEGVGSLFGDLVGFFLTNLGKIERRTLCFETSLGGVFPLAGLPIAWYLCVQIDNLPSHCEH